MLNDISIILIPWDFYFYIYYHAFTSSLLPQMQTLDDRHGVQYRYRSLLHLMAIITFISIAVDSHSWIQEMFISFIRSPASLEMIYISQVDFDTINLIENPLPDSPFACHNTQGHFASHLRSSIFAAASHLPMKTYDRAALITFVPNRAVPTVTSLP